MGFWGCVVLLMGIGCVLPRSTPLAAGFIPDKAAVRGGLYAHSARGEEKLIGVHGTVMAPVNRHCGFNFVAGYVALDVFDKDAYYHETELGFDFVFGGGSRAKGGVVGFMGAGATFVGFGNFVKEGETQSFGAGYLRAGCQATIRAGKWLYLEPYFEWKGNSYFPVLFTLGTNLHFVLRDAKTSTMTLYTGLSVSSVTKSASSQSWLWTAGFALFW